MSKSRLAAFSFLTVLLVLALFNGVIGLAERAGFIKTSIPDSRVQYLEEPLFAPDGEGQVKTTLYAVDTLTEGQFFEKKGDRWRLFILGGSFAMGSPYVMQTHKRQGEGGIAAWVRASLKRQFGDDKIEVINAGAGGQNSHRVLRISEEVVHWQPDALFVATCNNEGVLPPSYLSRQLHSLPGYRTLVRALNPEVKPSERSYYTPQDKDSVALRSAFKANLEGVVRVSEELDVPLLLATLPVNLLYTGQNKMREVSPSLKSSETLKTVPEDQACLAQGKDLYKKQKFEAAIEVFEGCVHEGDALRGIGLSLYQLQRYEEAKTMLLQSVELNPMNRCRPSYNAVIREVANHYDHVHLVDLEGAANAASPHGIAGSNFFLDYCHMKWMGYVEMGETLLESLRDESLLPFTSPFGPGAVSKEQLIRELRLEELSTDPQAF